MQDTTEEGRGRAAALVLEDGTRYEGRAFGAELPTSGETVFNTAMTGYPESLTDPSYAGQILVTTYPLLGNYGAPTRAAGPDGLSACLESERIHPRAIVAQDYCPRPSHWTSASTLGQWLREEGVTGLCGVDTRALAKHLREHGSMLGRIEIMENGKWKMENTGEPRHLSDLSESPEHSPLSTLHTPLFYDPNAVNLVAETSCKEPIVYGDGAETVVLVDCGVKHNIIRCLLRRGVRVVRVPWDYDYTADQWDGVFVSNGPGNPDLAGAASDILGRAIDRGKPVCGICMGNQLLAKAAGARIYKLKYGHRGHNQPVRDLLTGRCHITSQNHGFAVDASTLGPGWEERFVNLNDGTNEGIRHKTLPVWSAQFHPEASAGPEDTEWIFDDFVSSLRGARR